MGEYGFSLQLIMSGAHSSTRQRNDSDNKAQSAASKFPIYENHSTYANNNSADVSIGSAHDFKFAIPRPGVLDFRFADAQAESQSSTHVDFTSYLDHAIASFATQLRNEILNRQETDLLLQQLHLYPRKPPVPPVDRPDDVQNTSISIPIEGLSSSVRCQSSGNEQCSLSQRQSSTTTTTNEESNTSLREEEGDSENRPL